MAEKMLHNYVGQCLIDAIFGLIGLLHYFNSLLQLLFDRIMPEKSLNLETMWIEILKNPEVYQSTFMILSSDYSSDLDSKLVKNLTSFIGEDKIQGLQLMREGALLVTMNNVDDMNDLLAAVKEIRDYGMHPNVTWAFIPVLPVPARVRIRISGIPMPLATTNMQEIKELLIKTAKELQDVTLSLEVVRNFQTGNLIADALTSDLKVTHGKIMSNELITFKNFIVTVRLIQSFPVKKENLEKFKPHGNMEVIPWS